MKEDDNGGFFIGGVKYTFFPFAFEAQFNFNPRIKYPYSSYILSIERFQLYIVISINRAEKLRPERRLYIGANFGTNNTGHISCRIKCFDKSVFLFGWNGWSGHTRIAYAIWMVGY